MFISIKCHISEMMYHERLDAKNLGLNIPAKTLVTHRIELTALLGQSKEMSGRSSDAPGGSLIH